MRRTLESTTVCCEPQCEKPSSIIVDVARHSTVGTENRAWIPPPKSGIWLTCRFYRCRFSSVCRWNLLGNKKWFGYSGPAQHPRSRLAASCWIVLLETGKCGRLECC